MSRLLSAVPSDLRLRHGPVERAPQDADPGFRRLTVGDESFGAAVEACSVWNAELFSDMRLIQTGRWCVRAPSRQTPMAAVASTGYDAAVSQDSSGGPRVFADRDNLCTTSPEPWRNAPAALANSASRPGCPL
ncbi:hypothetical protein SNOG_16026 [Parastagonospora nodorum SN15]|uniref:Uncharacterized protein n=1 Tax=Phaeosphaeria nodorum (strain SN15 / ATCC MYA-4574 / FGSC 10173) TaxID=321614 RepID=Q0TWU8_PHANO|nr:hypothetical protein SNOG_16026 [Parastagonospora nodorum SN15]EAT76605.1 hypothetical protein SNOG_16026 [Parastagonospora nodorum SN15]